MSAIAEARVNAGWQHMKRRTSVSSSSGAVSIAVHSVAVSASKANSLSRRRRAISVNTPDERYAVLLPFIQEGLELGEKAIHTVDPRRREEHLERLASAGIDNYALQQRGQFELRYAYIKERSHARFRPM